MKAHTAHTHTHARTHARTHTDRSTRTHTHTHAHTRTHARTHARTYTHTHTHTHTSYAPVPLCLRISKDGHFVEMDITHSLSTCLALIPCFTLSIYPFITWLQEGEKDLDRRPTSSTHQREQECGRNLLGFEPSSSHTSTQQRMLRITYVVLDVCRLRNNNNNNNDNNNGNL